MKAAIHMISLDENSNLRYAMRNKKRPVRVLVTLRAGLTKQPCKEVKLAAHTIPARPLFRQERSLSANFCNFRSQWCVFSSCPVSSAV